MLANPVAMTVPSDMAATIPFGHLGWRDRFLSERKKESIPLSKSRGLPYE